jgi:phage I-like protein
VIFTFSSGSLPKRIQLLRWGDNPSVKGTVKVGVATLAGLEAEQRRTGFEEIAVDFEHNTVPGSAEYERSQEPRAVAAYGVPRVIAGEGLFLEQVRWTPTGQREAANFADLSPAVSLFPSREVRFIHSAALTRTGAVPGLHLVLNSASVQGLRSTGPALFGFERALASHLKSYSGLPAGGRGGTRVASLHRPWGGAG